MSQPTLKEFNSALEEILKKSVIKFPWDLSVEQSVGLIKYMVLKLHELRKDIYVQYESAHSLRFGYQHGYDGCTDMEKASSEGSFTIKAPPFLFTKFELKSSERDKLESIQFLVPEGFEKSRLPEIRPEIMQLWDDVRGAVADYFEENPE